jgi:hypothetical protein
LIWTGWKPSWSLIRSITSITFGGIVLALAIAFGWGGTELAKDFLERLYKVEEGRDK